MLTHDRAQQHHVHGQTGDLGALVRNVGEVLGVFAEIDVERAMGARLQVQRAGRQPRPSRGLLTELQAPKVADRAAGPDQRRREARRRPIHIASSRTTRAPATPRPPARNAISRLQADDTPTPIHAYMQPRRGGGHGHVERLQRGPAQSRLGQHGGTRRNRASPARKPGSQFSRRSTVKLLRNAIIGSIVYKYEGIPDAVWQAGLCAAGPQRRDHGELSCRQRRPPTNRRPIQGSCAAFRCGMASDIRRSASSCATRRDP
jgi:hypothetical protein